MAIITPDNQIAAGNDNAGGLTLLTSIQDANGVYYTKVRSLPFRNRGERRVRLDGTVAFIGTNTLQWVSSAMTLAQYAKVLSTYEGLVTIRHPLTSTTFANYNAVLTMPDEADLEYVYLTGMGATTNFTGPGYRDVTWTFTKVEAL